MKIDSPYAFIISVVILWLVLGGVFQLFNIEDPNAGKLNPNTESKVGSFGFIFDLFTFNVNGLPDGISTAFTTFFGCAFALSLIIIIRGQ